MLFEVESLYELAKLIVLSKSTEISQFFGGIFVTNKDNSTVYFTFSDSEKLNDFMNIYFSKDELVNGKFLKFPIGSMSKRLVPVQGIEGPDIFIPLIYLHEDVDFNKSPKASPLVVKTKTFDDFLRSALGWPSLRAAFVKSTAAVWLPLIIASANAFKSAISFHLNKNDLTCLLFTFNAGRNIHYKLIQDKP